MKYRTLFLLSIICTGTLYALNSTPVTGSPEEFKAELIQLAENHQSSGIGFVYPDEPISTFAASVIRDDKLVWDIAWGTDVKDLEATTDSIYPILSVSKAFTATAAMKLNELDLLDLDTDINEYLPFNYKHPYYPNSTTTIRHLLAHRAGFVNMPGNDHLPYFDVVYNLNMSSFSCIDNVISIEPLIVAYPDLIYELYNSSGTYYTEAFWAEDSSPGEKFAYSNLGFTLAAFIIEQISEMSMYDFLGDHLLIPLGMTDTSFLTNDYDYDKFILPREPCGSKPGARFFPTYEYGAMSLLSTVNELSNFLIMHMNEGSVNNQQIMSKDSIEIMHNLVDRGGGPGTGYGLGWGDGGDTEGWVGHKGWSPFYRAMMEMKVFEKEKYGVIYFGTPPEDDPYILQKIKEKITEGLFADTTNQSTNANMFSIDIFFLALIITLVSKKRLIFDS